MGNVKKIVLPVGGLGTRFLPATKSLPKEMLPVFNKPIIQYAYDEAKAAGIDEFLFITGRNKNAINNHFDHAYELQDVLGTKQKHKELSLTRNWLPEAGQIAFVRQQEPLGLGHAIWCARNFIKNEPFAVTLADELLQSKTSFMSKMVETFNQLPDKANLIGVYQVPEDQVSKYGIIDFKNAGDLLEIKSMVEKPEVGTAPSNYAMIGRYILQPEIFDILNAKEIGVGGEIQLTDALGKLLKTQKFYALEFTEKRFDCGSPSGWLDANISFGQISLESEDFKQIIAKYS
ncbi:MAG: UTP--glucose-1-phosphate uridylyltransferase GalU [Rickettsiales bacterium]|jgi:UTP--glucose-1-phosphate uridylyltransferase|nr:UTP--glucose-1-phosphate uridylyltransferase GalU [Rickettsiales bacterium]